MCFRGRPTLEVLSLRVCPSTTQRSCCPISEASLSHNPTDRDTGQEAGLAGLQAPVLARTEKPSSLAHGQVETPLLPEEGDSLRGGRPQHPFSSGKDPSRGSHEAPSCITGFPKQMGSLGSTASRGFGVNAAPQNTCPTAHSKHQACTFHRKEAKGTNLVFMEWQRLPDGLLTHLEGSICGSASVFWGPAGVHCRYQHLRRNLFLCFEATKWWLTSPFGVKEKRQ